MIYLCHFAALCHSLAFSRISSKKLQTSRIRHDNGMGSETSFTLPISDSTNDRVGLDLKFQCYFSRILSSLAKSSRDPSYTLQ